MKKNIYFLFAFGAILALTQCPAQATATRLLVANNVLELDHEVAAEHQVAAAGKSAMWGLGTSPGKGPTGKVRSSAVLAMLGLAERKKVITPAKLNRQQHLRQEQLKAKARRESKAHRRRCTKAIN